MRLPISAPAEEQLRRLLAKARRNRYGYIEITVSPQGVKIVDRTEYRFTLDNEDTGLTAE